METWGVLVTNSTQKCVHDPHPTISNEETFLQDFVVILKRMLYSTTCIVICSACLILQLHSSVLAVDKKIARWYV